MCRSATDIAKLKRLIFAIIGLLACAALFLYFRRPELPEALGALVKRASLVQTLTTNGKVEALERVAVTVRAPVRVLRVEAREGDSVRRDQLLAVVDETAAREAVARAQAQLEVTRADRVRIERGGSTAELAELDTAIARARLERTAVEKEIASLQRLVERQAATRGELEDQRQRLRKAQSDLDGLDLKRRSLVGPEDRERVLAAIREAEAALAEAATGLRQTEIRSPEDGILYSMTLRPGGFYNTGELVGQVGRLDKVRVRVLVDEPELGRLQVGQPVRVTWDALPRVSWQGAVERLPSEVEMSGARSVGEVLCTIDNPGHRLVPNVTVDAEIRTGAAENALVIPREAVLREGDQSYVLLADDRGIVARHLVTLGIQDVNRVQVLEGLSENQVVLLPSEGVVSPGQKVRPKVQP